MTTKAQIWDDLQIKDFLPETDLEQGKTRRDTSRLALRELSQRLWLAYLDRLSDCGLQWLLEPDQGAAIHTPLEGQTVLLRHVVLENERQHAKLRLFDHRQGGLCWGIVADPNLQAMSDLIRDTSRELDFPPAGDLDLIAKVLKVVGADSSASPSPNQLVLVQIKAIRLPGQFAVCLAPEDKLVVPGLESARLKKQRDPSEVSKDGLRTPEQVANCLLEAVRSDNFELFRHLWLSEVSDMQLERRFNSARRSLAATNDNIAVDGFDPTYCLENFEQHGWIRLYLKRVFKNGSSAQTPLTMIKEEGQWRISKGNV